MLCVFSLIFLHVTVRKSKLSDLHDADCFRQDHLATDAHSCQVRHLVLNGEQFLQRLEGQTNTVNDLVALAEIAKEDWHITGCIGKRRRRCRVDHIRHFNDWTPKQRLAELIAKHGPDGPGLRISKEPAHADGVVAHEPGCSGSIARFANVHQLDDGSWFDELRISRWCGENVDAGTRLLGIRDNALRSRYTITQEECRTLFLGELTSQTLEQVRFHVEHAILKVLLGNLDIAVQLTCEDL